MTVPDLSPDDSSPTLFAERILDRARQLGLTKRELAKRAGLSRQTLANLLSATPGYSLTPSVQTLMSLSVVLRLHPFWLIDSLFGEFPSASYAKHALRGDRIGFVCDTSCPDGCVVEPGAKFQKIWTSQFLGAGIDHSQRRLICWDEHVEVLITDQEGRTALGQRLIPESRIAFPHAQDLVFGSVADFSVNFVAPLEPGFAFSYWRLAESDGTPVFSESAGMWVLVFVEPSPAMRAPFPGAETISISQSDAEDSSTRERTGP
jgi:transcriptional regulator with XRE-family HTH domain